MVEVGFEGFYKTWSDYLPGYLYILWFLGWLKELVPISPILLYKIPAILADVATGFLIYSIVKKYKNEKLGLIASVFYIFNPAVLANSSLWGQADSLTALFSLLAIWLIDIHPFASSLTLAFGTLIKPQAAFAAPVVLFVMLRRKWKTKKIFHYALISFIFFIFGFVPFAGGKNLISFVWERILTTLGQYPYTSVNAFNFWGLFGFWQREAISLQFLGLLMMAGSSLLAAAKLWKNKNARFLLAAVIFASSFLFLTRMHERHLLPVFAPLAIASAFNPSLWLPYIGFSVIYLANLRYSFVWITQDFASIFSTPVIFFLILLNLSFFFLIVFRILKKGKKLKIPAIKNKVLLIILVFSLITRIFALGSPAHEYFDEVYHAFTARQMLHGDPKAWEWWNTPPEGFAYEWTHPPLAKLGMILGMSIFGENSFGWRIPGALLGVGSVLLIFWIARELFKDKTIGLLASAIFALGGLPLVMSRIGMNESYLLFFSLLAICCFLTKRNFLSALSFGLALASKWSAVWLMPILLVSHFVFKRKIKLDYLWFLVLPPLVYLASYIPMFLTGHDFEIFVGVQKQMWWYHTRLKAEHAYTSPWWSWPFLARPIYLYTSNVVNGMVSKIYAMGNPLVFWFGIISIFASAFLSFVEKNKKLGFVVFSYFVFFAPWAVSPRIMFLYHYLPSLPFLAIASGFILKKYPKLILPIIVCCLLSFVYFYPHWAGLEIPVWLDRSYYWFSSWR